MTDPPDANAKALEPEAPQEGWRILLVEDDLEARRQIREYFAWRNVAGKALQFQDVPDWQEAFKAIRERKADLVILDVYRGQAAAGGERVGERVFEELKNSGFVSVVLYTNLPEGLEGLANQFVRLVPKTAGLPKLHEQLEQIFQTNVPQAHRAIARHLDRALRQYMWDFVVKNWDTLGEIASKPEFLRVLLQRLALSFVREGVDLTIAEVFPPAGEPGPPVAEVIHPAEFYIKPPLGTDPVLGDVRVRSRGEETDYLVVLWPTCDMVSTGGRTPKTDTVLCARANLLDASPEAEAFRTEQSKTARGKLEDLLTNKRQSKYGSPDRFHFLPGVLDIPDLVIDFQALEILPLKVVKSIRCLGSLASPHAELLGSRFDRYRGRIGTPDLNCSLVLDRVAAAVQPVKAADPAKTD